MKFLYLSFLVLLLSSPALAQYNAGGTQFYIGPKASINAARYTPAKNTPDLPSAHKNKLGFGAGFMYKFRVTDLISLHGEFNYTRKSRSVVDSTVVTEYQNFHLDAPILFEISFPAKLPRIGKFEYFFNAGPQLSYWISGKGITQFEDNPEQASSNYAVNLNTENINRLQYGIIFGVGMTLPSVGDNYFVVEARYSFYQTHLGEKYVTTLGDFTHIDDLRGNYNVLSLSVAYTFGLNFMPSSQKNKGMKVKTVVQ